MLFNFTLSALSPLLSISSDVLSMQFNGSSVWAVRPSDQSASNFTATLDGQSYHFRNGTRLVDVGANLFNITAPESNLLIPPAHDFTFEPAELVNEISWHSNLDSDLKAYLGPNYCWTQFWKYGFTPRGQWVNGDCLSSEMQAPDCYTTSEVGAYLELKFKGDGVTLYGTLENAGSGYSVSLDGAPFVSYSAGNITSPTNLALAHWNNIGHADHVLIVKNNPDSANPGKLQFTGYDLYVYESEFTNIVINDPAQKYNKNNFAGGAAIGGGIGGVLLIATLWLLRKRIIRKRREATARTAANPRMAGILGRDLEAAKATFVTNWLTQAENGNTDRDSTTTSSRPGSVHEKDAEKQAGLKPSEYGEPIAPAFALQLKNISQAEKELKAAEEGTSPSKESSSRSWNPFKWGKKDQS